MAQGCTRSASTLASAGRTIPMELKSNGMDLCYFIMVGKRNGADHPYNENLDVNKYEELSTDVNNDLEIRALRSTNEYRTGMLRIAL
uniref:Uncharacterized protein n=1 Tax=Meloidogyne floridensis TaxID=298350 RepID=A0A915NGY1_9BILA